MVAVDRFSTMCCMHEALPGAFNYIVAVVSSTCNFFVLLSQLGVFICLPHICRSKALHLPAACRVRGTVSIIRSGSYNNGCVLLVASASVMHAADSA